MSTQRKFKSITYTPTTEFAEQKKNWAERFGDIRVVEASPRLLLSFIKKNFYRLSQLGEEKVGPIANWIGPKLEALTKTQKRLENFLELLARKHSSSGLARNIFGCEVKPTDDDSGFWHSNWYQNKFFIPPFYLKQNEQTYDEFIENNSVVLSHARTYPLLDQLSFRLRIVQYNLNKNMRGVSDFDLQGEISKIILSFFDLFEEAKPYLRDLDKLQDDRRAQGAQKKHSDPSDPSDPSAPSAPSAPSVSSAPHAPRKQPSAPRATKETKVQRLDWSLLDDEVEDFADESVEETKEKSRVIHIPAELTKPVQQSISFADMAKKNIVEDDGTVEDDVTEAVKTEIKIKIEDFPEVVADLKVKPKVEFKPKAEPKLKPKAEPKLKPKAEPKLESKTETKSVSKFAHKNKGKGKEQEHSRLNARRFAEPTESSQSSAPSIVGSTKDMTFEPATEAMELGAPKTRLVVPVPISPPRSPSKNDMVLITQMIVGDNGQLFEKVVMISRSDLVKMQALQNSQ